MPDIFGEIKLKFQFDVQTDKVPNGALNIMKIGHDSRKNYKLCWGNRAQACAVDRKYILIASTEFLVSLEIVSELCMLFEVSCGDTGNWLLIM